MAKATQEAKTKKTKKQARAAVDEHFGRVNGQKAENPRAKIGHNGKGKKKRVDSKGEVPGDDPNNIQVNVELDLGPPLRDFKHHIMTIKGFLEKKDAAVARVRNAYKAAAQAGIKRDTIQETLRWMNAEPEEARLYFARLDKSFKALGVDVQLNMDLDPDAISRPAQIFDEGYKAGLAGKSSTENPHTEDTPQGQTWLHGYHAGQAAIVKGEEDAE